ncbi:MAG: phosphodiester glycosidase family protein [Gaiellaceae bacterium]
MLAVAVVLLVPVVWSYASWMLRPSSLPFTIRSVEWVRANHGAWLVNDVERFYYTHRAPRKGGPGIKALPAVGVAAVAVRMPAYRPPPRILPLIAPRLPGEGVWQPGTWRFMGEPPVLVTDFRPDPSYPSIVAYVAWIDRTRTRLALYPGRYEPPSGGPRGPMQVPADQRGRLLATFNSGFTYKDGHGGFAVDGVTYEPLRQGLATLVEYRSGRVDVTSWRGGSSPGPDVVLVRQNAPLLVAGGVPTSDPYGSAWGYTLGNKVRVWRSAVGIDKRGNLLYAAADYQTVASMAALMAHAGAVRAMELDINSEWPTFDTYVSRGGNDPIRLVPNYQQSPTRYLRPDDRDFFAVYAAGPKRRGTTPMG